MRMTYIRWKQRGTERKGKRRPKKLHQHSKFTLRTKSGPFYFRPPIPPPQWYLFCMNSKKSRKDEGTKRIFFPASGCTTYLSKVIAWLGPQEYDCFRWVVRCKHLEGFSLFPPSGEENVNNKQTSKQKEPMRMSNYVSSHSVSVCQIHRELSTWM